MNELLTKKNVTENYEFVEKDKVLSDLCQSKLLLEKTSHFTRQSPYNQPRASNNSVSYGSQTNSSYTPNQSRNYLSNNYLPTNLNGFAQESLPKPLNTSENFTSNRVCSLNGIDLVNRTFDMYNFKITILISIMDLIR